ncbi:hypothetical protein GCM10020218_017680 [Dactylosporangium vinaceum]
MPAVGAVCGQRRSAYGSRSGERRGGRGSGQGDLEWGGLDRGDRERFGCACDTANGAAWTAVLRAATGCTVGSVATGWGCAGGRGRWDRQVLPGVRRGGAQYRLERVTRSSRRGRERRSPGP